MSDINNFYEKLDRSLKRLQIILVDDFEEIKRGSPAPTVALIRKLLFNTSTIVMKYMLLRGCPSHVSDKKVVISLFDLLRETVKFSPSITIDQFFSTGFGQHKIQILTRLADYVTHVDRSAGRSTSKTAFVVANEVLGPLGDINSPSPGLSSATVEGLIASADNEVNLPISELIRAHLVNKGHSSSLTTGLTSSGAKRRPSTGGSNTTNTVRGRSLSNPRSREFAPLSPTVSMTVMSNKNSTFSPVSKASKADMTREEPVTAETRTNNEETNDKHKLPQRSPARGSFSNNSTHRASNTTEVSSFDALKVEELITQKVDAAVKEISDKYDMVLNKLVAAVDAEFTLLSNRIRALESVVQASNGNKKSVRDSDLKLEDIGGVNDNGSEKDEE